MTKERFVTTLLPQYKDKQRKLAKEGGLSMGQYIERMLDKVKT